MKRAQIPIRGSPEYIQLQNLLATKIILTTSEVAIYLDVSIHTVYKLIANKAFPFSKPNHGSIYIRRDDLDEWRTDKWVNQQTINKKVNKYFNK